jgi:D-glycero-D-manno-heptose 1,7-bisphosphate phosphatase
VSRFGVVVDRDGTLVDFVRDPELGVVTPAFHPRQLRFLPGALEGLRLFASRGVPVAVATNQPQAAKGEVPRDAIERTNAALIRRLADEGAPVLAIETCLHHPEGGDGGDPSLVTECDCRKPKPGLLLALATRFDLDLSSSIFVGDTPTDVRAARAAGMRAGLVTRLGRCELCPARDDPFGGALPDLVGPTLLDLAERILDERGRARQRL